MIHVEDVCAVVFILFFLCTAFSKRFRDIWILIAVGFTWLIVVPFFILCCIKTFLGEEVTLLAILFAIGLGIYNYKGDDRK